jgi:ABC-type transporter Mla maintaining outer membrane lipid asymmetry permease subunit MlaE
MKVTEEVDALRAIGVGSAELLVLPKMLALIIALPLLTVYADVTGIFGGMLMACSKRDVSFDVFLHRLGEAISLPEEYFSHTFALPDVDQAFAAFFQKTDGTMKVLIKP